MTSALHFFFPTAAAPNKLRRTHSGAANGRESIIALCECKGVLAQQKFTATKFLMCSLTSFSLLSNIRHVYWGSDGMVVGTSRCFKMTFQFGRPGALSTALPFRCGLFRHISVLPFVQFLIFVSNSNNRTNPSGHGLHTHGRKTATVFSVSA